MITLSACVEILHKTLKTAFKLDDRLTVNANEIEHSIEVFYNQISILKYTGNDLIYMISSLTADLIIDKERYKKIFKETGDLTFGKSFYQDYKDDIIN